MKMGRSRLCIFVAVLCLSKSWGGQTRDLYNEPALSASSYASLGIQPSGYVSDNTQGQARNAQISSEQPRKVIVIGCSGDGCSSPDFAPQPAVKQSYGSGNSNDLWGQEAPPQRADFGTAYGGSTSYNNVVKTAPSSAYGAPPSAPQVSSTSLGYQNPGPAKQASPSYSNPVNAASASSYGSTQVDYSRTHEAAPSYGGSAKQAEPAYSFGSPAKVSAPSILPSNPYGSSVKSASSATWSQASSYSGSSKQANAPAPSYSQPAKQAEPAPSYGGQTKVSAPSVQSSSLYGSPGKTASSAASAWSQDAAPSYGGSSKQASAPAPSYSQPASSYGGQPKVSAPSVQSSSPYGSPGKAASSAASAWSQDASPSYGGSNKQASIPASSYSQPAKQAEPAPSYDGQAKAAAPSVPSSSPYQAPASSYPVVRNPAPAPPELNYLPPATPAPAASSYGAPAVATTTAPPSSRTTAAPAPAASYYGNPAPPALPPQASNQVTTTVKPPTTPAAVSPAVPQPPRNPVTAAQDAPSFPYPGCAAALKCVAEAYCDMLGVMVNKPVVLSPIQKQFRVPLMSCFNPETNDIGYCCRDPLYNDPWPADMPMPNMAPAPAPAPLPVAPVVSATTPYQPPSTTPAPPSDECGVSRSAGQRSQSGDATVGELPWHALLAADNGTLLCSAVFIGESYAVTAAHCVKGMDPTRLRLRLGEHRIGVDNPTPYREAEVLAAVAHPEFEEGTLFNDIALVLLSHPVERDQRIGKVCLPLSGSSQRSSDCVATGWGRQVLYGQGSGVLNKAQVPILPQQECEGSLQRSRLGKYFKLHQSFTCAGSGSDLNTCKIDDGSPLVCQRSDGRYVLTGISSWSAARCDTQMPMVFTDVSKFTDWLINEMNSSESELVNSSNVAFQKDETFRAQFGSGAGYGR